MVIVQVAVSCPAHAPLQLAKLKPTAGVAVNVTVLPAVPEIVHAAPGVVQDVGVALGSLAVTEPLPPLAAEIASAVGANVAVALTAAWMLLSVQVAVSCPAHEPLQLAKLKFAAGVAVIVTVLPALPVMPHAAPLVVHDVGVAFASLAITEPLPPLAAEIASVMGVKFAVSVSPFWVA